MNLIEDYNHNLQELKHDIIDIHQLNVLINRNLNRQASPLSDAAELTAAASESYTCVTDDIEDIKKDHPIRNKLVTIVAAAGAFCLAIPVVILICLL